MADKKAPPTTYYCIVSHPQEKRLLLRDKKGFCCLPHFDHGEQGWFAHDVVEIRRSVQKHWGLDATVLRHSRDAGEEQVCELEVHDLSWQLPAASRWVGWEDLDEIDLKPATHRKLLEQWFAERDGQPISPQRPPWEYRGWYDEAVDWIEAQLALLGYRLEGAIEVFKAAWSWSAILRVPTAGEELYFKAIYAKPPSEVALISALAERWPENVPCILAADFERRWMLMRNFGGEGLEELPDERWAAAARLFAKIQIEEVDRLQYWLEMGCPRRGPAEMPTLWEEILADRDFLLSEPQALSPQEIDRMREVLPHWGRLVAQLAACPVPETLHQQDFRHGNLQAVGDTFLYYDWGDTVISHPFFSVNRMFDYIKAPEGREDWHWRFDHADDGKRRTIRDAYLGAYTDFAPMEELLAAFECSRQLNRPYQVIRWYHEARNVELASPYGSGMPEITRHILKETLQSL